MVHAGIAIAKITDEDDSETDQLMEELYNEWRDEENGKSDHRRI